MSIRVDIVPALDRQTDRQTDILVKQMHRRQSLFGALLDAVAIKFPTETYKSATAQFIRSSQPETSVCTSTVA